MADAREVGIKLLKDLNAKVDYETEFDPTLNNCIIDTCAMKARMSVLYLIDKVIKPLYKDMEYTDDQATSVEEAFFACTTNFLYFDQIYRIMKPFYTEDPYEYFTKDDLHSGIRDTIRAVMEWDEINKLEKQILPKLRIHCKIQTLRLTTYEIDSFIDKIFSIAETPLFMNQDGVEINIYSLLHHLFEKYDYPHISNASINLKYLYISLIILIHNFRTDLYVDMLFVGGDKIKQDPEFIHGVGILKDAVDKWAAQLK